jgi:hypothetical protein
MSGSGDYTLTPNLGLYKPNYALDVGQWGNHLNANADAIDAVIGAASDPLTVGSGTQNALTITPGTIPDSPVILTLSGTGALQIVSKLNLSGLPTSAAGLTAGDIWRNGTVLNIV